MEMCIVVAKVGETCIVVAAKLTRREALRNVVRRNEADRDGVTFFVAADANYKVGQDWFGTAKAVAA